MAQIIYNFLGFNDRIIFQFLLEKALQLHVNFIKKLIQIMTTINGQEIVTQEIRDSAFKQLKKINKNNICIDCQKKNPTWASIHLGVQLCIDCAGKHRQYGVMYSFVKSTNLDKWNRKQLIFMQKGGNQRALQYLTKCGVIGENHKHIDYKSPIVQRYKTILTAEVQSQIFGKPFNSNNNSKQTNNPKIQKTQQSKQDNPKIDAPKQIPNAQSVQTDTKGKKKTKKKIGNKINLQDFDNLVLDDGVPLQQKQKIVKAYQSSAKNQQNNEQLKLPSQNHSSEVNSEQTPKTIVQPPKQMTEQQTKQKLEQLKAKQNVKSISSEQFKDTTIGNDDLKMNLNKFQSSQSISSSAFFGQQSGSTEDGTVDKLKDFVADTSVKLYGKLASYWSKK